MGDKDGPCPFDVCNSGSYFLDLNVIGRRRNDPDAVFQLNHLFNEWKQDLHARPDHLESTTIVSPPSLVADGQSESTLKIELADFFGRPLNRGAIGLRVHHHESSAGLSRIGQVQDHGNGTYTVPLHGARRPGQDVFQVEVGREGKPGQPGEWITLYPFPTLELKSSLRLFGDSTTISNDNGGTIELRLQTPDSLAGRTYLILASASGTEPGIELGSLTVPLNPDSVTTQAFVFRNSPPFLNTHGQLDAQGDALATFAPVAGDLAPFVGMHFSFAFITLDPTDLSSSVFRLEIVP